MSVTLSAGVFRAHIFGQLGEIYRYRGLTQRHFHQLHKDNDKKLLKSFFSHPTSANIQWNEAERLLKKLGAELKEAEGSRVKIALDDQVLVFHKPHGIKGLNKPHVETIRKFLQKVGVKNPEE